MNTATLLADPEAIRLDCVRPSLETITLVVQTAAARPMCPRCQRRSSRAHSRYVRRVSDLPWHGVSVKLELHTRRFRCQNSLCTQRIFCERLPRVVAHYARQTVRLNAALELIGFAIGGEAGARLARELGLTVRPDTLLRQLRFRFDVSHRGKEPEGYNNSQQRDSNGNGNSVGGQEDHDQNL